MEVWEGETTSTTATTARIWHIGTATFKAEDTRRGTITTASLGTLSTVGETLTNMAMNVLGDIIRGGHTINIIQTIIITTACRTTMMAFGTKVNV